MRIKVHTYNILSPSFTSTAIFPRCVQHHLDSKSRYNKILKKLEQSIQGDAVICLQEVPGMWKDDLTKFFADQGYDFITSVYKKEAGVGIAYSSSKYTTEDIDISCIRDTKLWSIHSPWKSFQHFSNTNSDPWRISKARINSMITIGLVDKENNTLSQSPFYIGTYHMPCLFRHPSVMVIHSSLIAQHIQRISSGKSYVLAGDFNFKPHSAMYELLQNGLIDKKRREYPSEPHWDDLWTPEQLPMKSAYVSKLGREPLYTNYPGSPFHFQETLDYLFYSPELDVLDVVPLPEDRIHADVMPNETEPSDHLLIGATFLRKE